MKGVTAPPEVQTEVRRLITEEGEPETLKRLSMSPQTVARIAAGLPVNRSSVELARLRLGIGGAHG